MTYKEINSLHQEICNAVLSRHLKSAFDQLSILIGWLQFGEWEDKKREMETTYQYMLQYMIDGIEDPEQTKIYDQLRISTLETADLVKEQLMLRNSVDYISTQKRNSLKKKFPHNAEIITELSSFNANVSLAGLLEESLNATGKSLEFSQNHEDLLNLVFNHFWLTDKYKETEIELLQLIFSSQEIQSSDKCVIISAITLSLLRTFDETKFNLLLDIYNDRDEQIKQRAIIGFLLCTYFHNERTQLYNTIINRISLLIQDHAFIQNMQTIILQFIRSKETEKISKKIKEDFIPEMAKISPFIKEKINLDELMKDENSLLDKNPEWQEILDKTGISDKIQQFAELQIEGADVFMSTFSSMKNFPFFFNICNWFMPFGNHSSVTDFFKQESKSQILEVMVKSPFLCNSDKYSLVFSLMQMPQSYRDMMTQSLKMESEQIEEIKKNEELLAQSNKGENISNQYIQDIYRFFKLYNKKEDFIDPFNLKLDFFNLFFIKSIENFTDLLRNFGEIYFNKDFYDEAVEIFEYLLPQNRLNIELYQKIGYCFQRKSNFEKALYYYKKADLIQPENLWNLKKMAFCYRSLKNSEIALKYYLQVEKQIPEDLSIQLNIGHCYLEQKLYKEALQVFFKIEYLTPQNNKVWRPIAWCSFVTGKFEQAEKYYKKIENKDKNHHDWLNLGHIAMCMKDKKNAIFFYKKSLDILNFNLKTFSKIFEEDIPFLIVNGVQKNEIPIIIDKLRYEIQQ